MAVKMQIAGRDRWPDTGELDGKPVHLPGIEDRIDEETLTRVVVEVPGVGRIRPWRFLLDTPPVLGEDGALVI